MPEISKALRQQKDKGGFVEIHEVVRVFTVHDEINDVIVRISIWRYYHEVREAYSAEYERQLEDGSWETADYGQILHGSSSEEETIERSIAFVRQAHKNFGKQ